MATNLRMQRPTWVFSTLGAAILLGFVSILCFAVQAWLASAFFMGLCAFVVSRFRALSRRHGDRGRAVVRAVLAEQLDPVEVVAVPRGEEVRGMAADTPVTVYTGAGHEAGLLPYFSLTATRRGWGGKWGLTEAEHAVMLPWLKRLPALEVEGERVRMQFSSWPDNPDQVALLLRSLLSVVDDLEGAKEAGT